MPMGAARLLKLVRVAPMHACRHARRLACTERPHLQELGLRVLASILQVLAGDRLPELGLLREGAAELGHESVEPLKVLAPQREAARVCERRGGAALRLVEPHGELAEPRQIRGLGVRVQRLRLQACGIRVAGVWD